MIDYMADSEVEQMLQIVKSHLQLKSKSWDDIAEDDPTPDEVAVIEEYLSVRV